MRTFRLFALISLSCFLFLFLFNSCAALKKRKYEPDVMETAKVSPAIDSAVETPDFIAGEWPAYNWWNLFKDEKLSEIMEIAIENNPDLKAAVSRVYASDEEAKKARSVLMPQFSTGIRDNYEHLSRDSLLRFPPSAVPSIVNQIFLALNFEYEIDLFGKNRNKYRAAIGKAKAQSAEMSAALLMITTSLTQSYINYAANLQNLEFTKNLVEAKKKLFELTILRFSNSIDDQMAIDTAEASLLDMEEAYVIFEKEVELNLSQIKILMGLGPDETYPIPPPTLTFDRPFPLPDDIPLNLLARRPDLMAQIWTVEAAAHLISAAKAAFFPNINLKAFVGLETLSWSNFFTANSFGAALTPAINLPLFTGGDLKAQLNQEYANYDTAVYDYNALLLRASKEVFDQIKILQAANENSRLQSEVLENFVHISELKNLRFENGIDNYLTLLESQINAIEEGIKDIEKQNERFLSVLQLIKALGGGYHDR